MRSSSNYCVLSTVRPISRILASWAPPRTPHGCGSIAARSSNSPDLYSVEPPPSALLFCDEGARRITNWRFPIASSKTAAAVVVSIDPLCCAMLRCESGEERFTWEEALDVSYSVILIDYRCSVFRIDGPNHIICRRGTVLCGPISSTVMAFSRLDGFGSKRFLTPVRWASLNFLMGTSGAWVQKCLIMGVTW